jgi:O-antigen/teichoic acid export membrane protein
MSAEAGSTEVHASRSRDAGVLVMGRVLATASDALLPLVLVRLLGKADVGVLGSVLLLYQTVAIVLATDLPTALMYYLPGRPAVERRAIAWQMAYGLFGFGVVTGGLLLITGLLPSWAPALHARLFDNQGSALLRSGVNYLSLLALFPLGDLPARMLPNLLVIEGRSDAAARFAVIKSVGNALFVLVPAGLGLGIRSVIMAYSVFGLMQGAILVYFLRVLYVGAQRRATPITFLTAFRFALPLGVTDIVAQFNSRLDRYLISASYSVAVFAEYQVGAFQIPIVGTIAYSVGTAYMPHFTQLLQAGKAREAIDAWRVSIPKVALIVVPCSLVFVVGAEEVVSLLFTPAYLRAAGVFRWYALLTMLRAAAFGSVIIAAGKPQLLLRAAILALLANAVLSSTGLWLFGFEGPAMGTALALLPNIACYCYYIAKATGLPVASIYPVAAHGKILLLGVVAALPALLIKIYLHLPMVWSLSITTLLILGGFLGLGLASGQITRDDVRYVRRWLRVER